VTGSLRGLLCGLLLSLLAPSLQAAGKPSEVLDEFHKSLRTNQPDKVMAILSADAVIYEQGFADVSRDEWLRKQLGNAIAFARDTDRRVVRRQAGESGDMAWVISTTQTTIDVSDRKVVLEGAETAILRLEGGDWKIVHLHWSAHEASPDDAAKPTQKESNSAAPRKPSAKAPIARSTKKKH
jgi:ketosteroid isomerase-like protein